MATKNLTIPSHGLQADATMCNNYTGNSTSCPTGKVDVLFVTVYSLVFCIGLVLNITALVVFFRHTKTRSYTTVYMINLALADLFLVLTLPMRIMYHLDYREINEQICDCLGLALLVNMYGSIFLLTCISFDRCMAVSFPMSSLIQEGRKKAPLVCLGVWMLTIGSSLPNYLMKRLVNSTREDNCCFNNWPIYAAQPMAVFTAITIGFGIPLIVMLLCSWGLVRAVRQSIVAQMELINSGKIQRMIAASLLIFLISFLPYHATLGVLYHYKGDKLCWLSDMYHYSLMVACLNAMLDPMVYYFTTETFRKKVDITSVRKMFPLNSHSSTEENNKIRRPINT